MLTDYDIYQQWGIAGLVTVFLAARRQLSLFQPTAVYLAFHFIVFCARPTLVHFFEFDSMWIYMRLIPTGEAMRQTLLLSSVGLVTFCLAYSIFSAGARPLEFATRPRLSAVERRAFYTTAMLFVPLGLFSIFGAETRVVRVGDVAVNTGTSGYLNDLQQVFIPLSILFVLVARWRWWSYIPFIAFVYFRAGQGWARWTMLLPFFLLVLVWLWDHRKKIPPLKFLIPAPFLLFLFINMSHNRAFFQAWLSGKMESSYVTDESKTFKERWDTSDFANFDFLTYIVSVVPEKTGTYTYGTQYLQLFTEPIPRAIWKAKPAGQPVRLLDLNEHGNFYGMTPSLVGDGWMSGGWVGAILTMSLVGGVLGFLYKKFTMNTQYVHRACAYLIVNAMIIQLFRDGGISIFKFLLFTLTPLYVWKRLSEYYRRQEEMARDDENEEEDEADEDEDEDEEADESDEDAPDEENTEEFDEDDETDDDESDDDAEEPPDTPTRGDRRPFHRPRGPA